MDSIDVKIMQTLPCYEEYVKNLNLIQIYSKKIEDIVKYDLSNFHIASELAQLSKDLLYFVERCEFLNKLLLLEYKQSKED